LNLVLLLFSGCTLLIASWVAYRVVWLRAPAGSSLGLDMVAPSAWVASLQCFIAVGLCFLFAYGLRFCLRRTVPKAFD
jgi:hypothetical protein